MRRKLPRTAVFLLFQLTVTVLLVEIALRAVRPYHKKLDALLYYASVETEFDEVKSTPELLERSLLAFAPRKVSYGFVLNSRSFRTKDYAGARRPGSLRVMVVGDSFSYACGGLRYHMMWPSRLEEKLAGRGVAAEVFTLGVPAVGPMFELRLWELEHSRVRPDVVVMAFFVGNDFTDEREHRLAPWTDTTLVRSSYTWRLVRNLYRLSREELPAAAVADEGTAAAGKGGYDVDPSSDEVFTRSATKERFLNVEWNRMRLCAKQKREIFEELAQGVEKVLARFADEVRVSDQEFLVMLVPDEFQVNAALRRDIFERFDIAPDDVEPHCPQARLRPFLDEAGIAYLDLLPAFLERSRHESLYIHRNTHWNERGNALAAELLADYLEEHRAEPLP